MSIRELIDQFTIQGAYHIKVWENKISEYETLSMGEDFEDEQWDIDEDILNRVITYMYVVNGALHIEVEETEEE